MLNEIEIESYPCHNTECCCICLDECNDKFENEYINFQCCNGTIHRKCLLTLILNDFTDCPLCRTSINIKCYFTVLILNDYLTISEIRLYKIQIYTLLKNLIDNKFIYYINILSIELCLFIDDPRLYIIAILKIFIILCTMALLIFILCSLFKKYY